MIVLRSAVKHFQLSVSAKVIKGYVVRTFLQHNLFNLVASDSRKCFTTENSRIITLEEKGYTRL